MWNTDAVTSAALHARELGPRGSRTELGHADPAGLLTSSVAGVLASIPAWWASKAAASGLSGKWTEVECALDYPVPAFATVEPTLPTNLSGFGLGAAYTAALTPQTRARHGRHYTPADLAEHMWAVTRKSLGHGASARLLKGTVRDPSCGAGALLVPPLREHLAAVRRSAPQITLAGLPRFISGVDADPVAVYIANVVLAAEALPVLAEVSVRSRRPLPAMAQIGDGLKPAPASPIAVVMNPPYGRVRLSDEDRARFASFLYGHANLYALFMAAALDDIADDGVITGLVPTSFTAGRYFTNLRSALAEKMTLRDVTFVAERDGVFDGVLQETCIASFTRSRGRKTAVASINGAVTHVAAVKAPRIGGPWVLPRNAADAPIAAAAASMPLTLKTAGWKVSTGPLVWNRRREDLSPDSGPGRLRVIWAADIDGGTLHQDKARDGLRFLTLHGDKDRQTNTLSTPAILVQRTTAPEQRRRLVVSHLSQADLDDWGGHVVVENHVNVLRPVGEVTSIDRATLARILATQTLDRLVRCISGSVALSAYELESLPLPSRQTLLEWSEMDDASLQIAVHKAYRGVDA